MRRHNKNAAINLYINYSEKSKGTQSEADDSHVTSGMKNGKMYVQWYGNRRGMNYGKWMMR